MKRLVLESTVPFQGLPELVAYDEGLFEREGPVSYTHLTLPTILRV